MRRRVRQVEEEASASSTSQSPNPGVSVGGDGTHVLLHLTSLGESMTRAMDARQATFVAYCLLREAVALR